MNTKSQLSILVICYFAITAMTPHTILANSATDINPEESWNIDLTELANNKLAETAYTAEKKIKRGIISAKAKVEMEILSFEKAEATLLSSGEINVSLVFNAKIEGKVPGLIKFKENSVTINLQINISSQCHLDVQAHFSSVSHPLISELLRNIGGDIAADFIERELISQLNLALSNSESDRFEGLPICKELY